MDCRDIAPLTSLFTKVQKCSRLYGKMVTTSDYTWGWGLFRLRKQPTFFDVWRTTAGIPYWHFFPLHFILRIYLIIIHNTPQIAFASCEALLWRLHMSLVSISKPAISPINALSLNSDQQQFSPNNVHTLSRDKIVRI